MREEWASKSAREHNVREARIAARNARMSLHPVPAPAERSVRKAEMERRSAIVTIVFVGSLALYGLTRTLDRAVDWPTTLVFATSGIVAGGVFGALAKAESRTMRVLQICAGAIALSAIFVLRAREDAGHPYWWYKF
ncbi:MAG: hypothetical protein H7Z40_19490 [Phycisphaerae bacterium]|nr:hypothetical protein [Gemmatimonadaceae bacterium]